MRKITLCAVALVLCRIATSQAKVDKHYLDDTYRGVFYEMYVPAFHDSNNDGIGDLNGITAKLDYLKQLGVTAIVLSPLPVADPKTGGLLGSFSHINPALGNEADLKGLLNTAHNMGVKVLLTLPPTVVAKKHPWFQQALAGDTEYTKRFTLSADMGLAESGAWFKMPGGRQVYYARQGKNLPNLNLYDPGVKSELIAAGRYWLSVGVDGFIADMADNMFPRGENENCKAWWEMFHHEVVGNKPGFFMIGDVEESDTIREGFLKKAFSSCYNLRLATHLAQGINHLQNTRTVQWLITQRAAFEKANPFYMEAFGIGSFTRGRAASLFGKDTAKIQLAAALLFTLPGSPFFKAGDELAMRFPKPGRYCPDPFAWEKGKKNGGNAYAFPSKYSSRKLVKSQAEQAENPNSMFSWYQSMLTLKKQYPELTYGRITDYYLQDDTLVSFIRQSGPDERSLVIHNLSATPREITDRSVKNVVFMSRGSAFDYGNNRITIGPWGTMIFRY